MKISNSKKELARIINENGGWRDGAEFTAQDGDGTGSMDFFKSKPIYNKGDKYWIGEYAYQARIKYADVTIKNFHQTILSREEYFHLYPSPSPDADGWIEWKGDEGDGRPVDGFVMVDVEYYDKTQHFGHIACNVNWSLATSYRIHETEIATDAKWLKTVPAPEEKLTIEQLAADYRNRKDYADRKQEEADAAKAEADAKLEELVAAGKAIGLVVSVSEEEPELVITDWRDLREGDEIVSYYCPCVVVSVGDSEVTLRNRIGSTKNVNLENGVWTFIRRP